MMQSYSITNGLAVLVFSGDFVFNV